MLFRGSISIAIAGLLASIATAQAFDDAKYPDLFGVILDLVGMSDSLRAETEPNGPVPPGCTFAENWYWPAAGAT